MLRVGMFSRASIILLSSTFVGLFPLISDGMTLHEATNITSNSLDLSWSKSGSAYFSRYEIYQSLKPIHDTLAPSIPTLSEWAMLTLFLVLLLVGILLIKKRHKTIGVGLILLSISTMAYGVIHIPPVAVITDINQTSHPVTNLLGNTNYYFRVCCFHADGSYDLSNQIMARTLPTPGIPPAINSFSASPGTINFGENAALSWNITNATSASINQGVGSVNATSGSTSVSPATTTIYTLTATNAAGSVTAQATVTVSPPPTISSFSADPGIINSGESSTLSWIITNATSASIDQGVGSVNSSSGSTGVSPTTTTTYTLTASNPAGSVTAQATVTVSGDLPPDPKDVAPPVDPTVATAVGTSTGFLYSGPNPIQTGVLPGTIEAKRAAVLRGKVLDRNNNPLPGASISILNHPEYGQTLSRADGMFDMAVNGGGFLTVNYAKDGYLPAQRQVYVPWQDYAWLPDVVLITPDPQVTTIDLTAGIPIQVARGSVVTDSDGTRQATLFFPQGTQAQLVMPDGSTQPIARMSVRITEYTVGPNGPMAMPAELPPTSFYTYAVEFDSDEALGAGAKTTLFSQTVSFYLENFLNFPVGIQVPVGTYDREKGVWIPSPDGRVIKILSITAGRADLDTDGDNLADTGVALGVSDDERQQLAALYTPGQSLWRVPITHFSQPYDCNYGDVDPPDATDPSLPGATLGSGFKIDNPCTDTAWGTIECQNQIFGESVPVTGTPFGLHYSSDRVLGYKGANTVTIPLSQDTLPASLKRIDLEVLVAGRKFNQSFPAAANQSHTFVWDGMDAYGRAVQSRQPLTLRIGYVYTTYYALPPNMAASFGYPSGVRVPGDIPARRELTRWQEQVYYINPVNALGFGLGGWTLSVHHVYDPQGRVLYYGDGRRRSVENTNLVIKTVAGGGNPPDGIGDGLPATEAKLGGPKEVAVAPDGSLYIGDTVQRRVRRVNPGGIITTFAGTGELGFSGDGGPATQAKMASVGHIALGPDGSFYFSDSYYDPSPGGLKVNRVRRVGPDGIINTVAGSGNPSSSGDGGPATQAGMRPQNIDVGPDGSLYISDGAGNNRYRRVGPDGIIQTVVGTGIGGFTGDGGPATQANINPEGVAVGPDGSLYVADNHNNRVRRVGTDGIITTVAGSGQNDPPSGDGGPAILAAMDPNGIKVGRDGALYIADFYNAQVRRVGPDGIIQTIASGRTWDAVDGAPALAGLFGGLRDIAIGPDGSIYLPDPERRRVLRVSSTMPGFDAFDILIPSENGSVIDHFNPNGRHLKTIHALTGATLFEFGYDSGGRLASITDGNGNVTTIERDSHGTPEGIVGPYGQRTALTVNGEGYLASVANPAGETTQFGYGNEGLLTSVTGPRGTGFTYSMAYDSIGRLIKAEDPAGGSSTLSRTELANGHRIDIITAMGRTSNYLFETLPSGVKHYRNTFQDGTVAESSTATDGTATTTFSDGTTTINTPGPDPRFGMQTPLMKNSSVTTGGLTFNTDNNRTATLTDPKDPLSLSSMADVNTLNGRVFTTNYNAATGTFTATSPMGRPMTFTIDSLGRITGSQVPGLEPKSYSYTAKGRLSSVGIGSGGSQRLTTLNYNTDGYLESLTNPLAQTTRFVYDLAGRISRKTFPDTREVQYGYDGHGNLTSLVTPLGYAHSLGYSPADLLSSYAAPGPTTTSYLYNNDRQLTRITRPEGTFLDFGYDASGRMQTTTLPGGGQIIRTYNGTTGQLNSITAADGGTLDFGYEGGLATSETWAGAVAGSVSRTYDHNFWLSSRSINGGNTIWFQYDDDGLLVNAGDLTLSRDAQNGLLTGSVLGNVTDTITYNGFAEPIDYTANYGGSPLLYVQYAYDKLGQITQKTETIGGTDVYEYVYDLAGRLETVKKNTVIISIYTYDANGNRLSYSDGITTLNGTYDPQDRLLTYGTAGYQYTANGELQSKTIGGLITTYQYDALGNLISVTLPDATQVQYVVDGLNRRMGKKINGTLVKGLLYGDQLKPVAELDGSNNLISTFVYGSRVDVPDYMVKGGVTYRIISDYLGSPRLIVDTATGAVAQRMDYDEFGRVLADTNPGFQPFGFAGGLYDPDTSLVRFGARDYDAETGRWTAKDPILFRGGSANLYSYVQNNPINKTDRIGLGPGGSGYNRKPNLNELSFDYGEMERLERMTTDRAFLKWAMELEFEMLVQTGQIKVGYAEDLLEQRLAKQPLRPDEFISGWEIYRRTNDGSFPGYIKVWGPCPPIQYAKGAAHVIR